ncbi:hypothetical protein R1sor_015260 [Riccia sorocarpa]|uniref:Metal-nicotianamine transporter YSL6 n=1 Tax=Riccia sorocarpa TaxID=122646 RepID=A0ABD3HDK5_9MARC
MSNDGNRSHSVMRRAVHDDFSLHPVATDDYAVKAAGNGGPEGIEPEGGFSKFAGKADEREGIEGTEAAFLDVELPPWREQITLRALVIAAILGAACCIITHRLDLLIGIVPPLNIAAGLLGFIFIKTWVTALTKMGFSTKPFTRQENTVIQSCVVACYAVAYTGGFGSYLLGMATFAYEAIGPNRPGNTVQDIKNPQLGWIIGFLFTVALLGTFVLVPLRKVMIIDYKLIFPSGTATAVLINSFHTPSGAKVARKQVNYLGKYFSFSFAWSFFKWFFSGIGPNCGFDNFPSLGIKAFTNKFYFDFNLTFVGTGILLPPIVSCSLIFGAVISWGIMWPLIRRREGEWYQAGLDENRDFRGLFGYKVFIFIAIILGDGIYNLSKLTFVTLRNVYILRRGRQQLPTAVDNMSQKGEEEESFDDKRRKEVFLQNPVPNGVAFSGYVVLSIISIKVMPLMFPSLKWYYVLVAYVVGPLFAFCNAYGAGLTDFNLATSYGKLILFCFAAWAGKGGGGILAGLAGCGVMMSILVAAAVMMQDLKTGYLTLSSPKSMLAAQLIGGLMGCVLAPVTFWLFWTAYDIGDPNGTYKAPIAILYRSVALLGIEGFGLLPKHCLQLCYGWCAVAILFNAIRDSLPSKFARYVPIPMAFVIPFYLGGYFAIDMFVGTSIVYFWERVNKKKARTFSPAIASGLICGDGLWTIPAAILSFAKVTPPICMRFLRAKNPLLATLGS